MNTVLVLGATSGIAQEVCRLWAPRHQRFLLVGRDEERLDTVAGDLRVRGATSCEVMSTDLGEIEGVQSAFDWAWEVASSIDVVLIAFGTMPVGDRELEDVAILARTLRVTGDMNVIASHLAVTTMLEQGHGSLVVIGSVAGDRGRRSNYVYGSAKAMVETAVEGLRHRTFGSRVSVTLMKPGPTATRMTRHLQDGKSNLAPVRLVASDIVSAVDARQAVCYSPRRWAYIMSVIKALPRRVFDRLPI